MTVVRHAILFNNNNKYMGKSIFLNTRRFARDNLYLFINIIIISTDIQGQIKSLVKMTILVANK